MRSYRREDGLALARGSGPGIPVPGVVVMHAQFEELEW